LFQHASPITHHRIDLESATLHYVRTGTGSENLLLFHGFGQDHQSFDWLTPELTSRFTIYIFDLFFHGQSEWRDEAPLEKSFWAQLLNSFLQRHEIDRFSVAGFSLGARLALASFECCPARTDRLILLAPDGITLNFWYRIATGSSIMRGIFRSMIHKPGRFRAIAFALRELKLLDKRLLRFAESQMNTEARRERVYGSWVIFRRLRFDPHRLAQLISSQPVKVIFVLAESDQVIREQHIRRLTSLLPSATVHRLPGSHHQLMQRALSTPSLFD
jgi:pimeloyl-ACP methyl ester carboxylesterase